MDEGGSAWCSRCDHEEFLSDLHGARAALETLAGAIATVLGPYVHPDDVRRLAVVMTEPDDRGAYPDPEDGITALCDPRDGERPAPGTLASLWARYDREKLEHSGRSDR
jgi:hypothetical protein